MERLDADLLLRTGQKKKLPETRIIQVEGITVDRFPTDREAIAVFSSLLNGFVRPELSVVSTSAYPLHYSADGFEGVRVYYSPFGSVFPNLSWNIARFLFSFTGVEPDIAIQLLTNANAGNVECPHRSDVEIFRDITEALKEGREPTLWFYIETPEGRKKIEFPWRLKTVLDGQIREYTAFEIDAAIKALVFLNGLVSRDYFKKGLLMTRSGYIRPHFWVSSEGGLGVPTVANVEERFVAKPFAWGVSTQPWGKYLKDEHYQTGLDVVIGPFERIGNGFFTGRKLDGHYINSLLNINVGVILGYGEIIALNRSGLAVEGSAENLFVMVKEGDKYVCYTPPLSDGPLMGTTRLRMIQTLEERGIKVRYKSLPPEELYKAEAVFFTGTGAQIIHIRSISKVHELDEYVECMRARAEEDNRHSILIPKLTREEHLINSGAKHPILDELQTAYVRRLIENPINLEPAYAMHDPKALASLVGLDFNDITTRQERRLIESGFLRDRINVLRFPEKRDEVVQRYRLVAGMIAKAVNLKAKQGKQYQLEARRLKKVKAG
ncbi:MAG TPA: aminotransferase class IV [Candidatus Bilamarchaeaceae archaeon]|nr:aminotransferase class IV [Candidatus Bilamarchaeaceae archaeon]